MNLNDTDKEEAQDKSLVKWDKKLEIGIPAVDEQHRTLVELCNKLYLQIFSNTTDWKSCYEAALKECYDYTQTHFTYEEKLMEKVGYPDLEAHRKSHRDFMKKVLVSSTTFDGSSITDAISLSKFLFDWILSHIALEDKMFVKPVKEYLSLHKPEIHQ